MQAHPLEAWRRANDMTLDQLGAALGVTPEAAGRYCRGRIPRPAIMEKVYQVTGGAVQPNDFYGIQRTEDRGQKTGAANGEGGA